LLVFFRFSARFASVPLLYRLVFILLDWESIKHYLVQMSNCCTREQWRNLVFSPRRASLA